MWPVSVDSCCSDCTYTPVSDIPAPSRVPPIASLPWQPKLNMMEEAKNGRQTNFCRECVCEATLSQQKRPRAMPNLRSKSHPARKGGRVVASAAPL
ncbi:unnamed protein product [Protopolystoma xenopodis]|uniref:Uncharacterized protein n=1 Tax=Protopolystoma xenopodis TaxID=117903 RepID=A0A3S5B060_9PLAT|nr:unnamed protein product [Protopolystoma xenopodis]